MSVGLSAYGLGVALLGAVAGWVGAASPVYAASEGAVVAQLGSVGPGGPSYGYQPYNDRNPTGFYHPNGMGFGHYYLTQKNHGHRFHAFGYRRFRGN